MQLNVLSVIALWLVISTGAFLVLLQLQLDSSNDNDTTNTTTPVLRVPNYKLIMALLFFNNLNMFIAGCEIVLGTHIRRIQSDYQKFKTQYDKKEIQAAFNFLFLPVPLHQLFNGAVIWSRMWSTYSLYDPSYQNPESFGFFIDVGNGWSTIPPCILVNLAMTTSLSFNNNSNNDNHSNMWNHPLLVGCIGLASYWQILYGTIIYFLSYFYNQRYKGKTWQEVVGFVGVSNGIWFFFPIVGIYACVCILDTKDYSVFGLSGTNEQSISL